jgi:hypothetical protein
MDDQNLTLIFNRIGEWVGQFSAGKRGQFWWEFTSVLRVLLPLVEVGLRRDDECECYVGVNPNSFTMVEQVHSDDKDGMPCVQSGR